MKRLLCLVGRHDWEPLKWGIGARLDCRECRRCDRFQVVAFGNWHDAYRASFPDVTVAP